MGNKVKDSLGDRMKEFYENRSKTYLPRRVPVIIRLDGKAFHSFTKGFQRPYDEVFHKSMNDTMLYLCKNIQGCKLGYTQSDEITLLLTDYDTITTDAWFGYGMQKVCSVAASMATLEFNRKFEYYSFEWWSENQSDPAFDENYGSVYKAYIRAKDTGAMFDARCFSIPKDEVVNCFIWRQQDATRNAIQMLGQCNFSHKELQGKSCDNIQDMLMTQREINFNDMPVEYKRGVCCIKEEYYPDPAPGFEDCPIDATTVRTRWVIDKEIPIFTQNREYVEKFF
jgi:tRNA(His) 5'-end guanylyltransferase